MALPTLWLSLVRSVFISFLPTLPQNWSSVGFDVASAQWRNEYSCSYQTCYVPSCFPECISFPFWSDLSHPHHTFLNGAHVLNTPLPQILKAIPYTSFTSSSQLVDLVSTEEISLCLQVRPESTSYLNFDGPGEITDINEESDIWVVAKIKFLVREAIFVLLNVGFWNNRHLFSSLGSSCQKEKNEFIRAPFFVF